MRSLCLYRKTFVSSVLFFGLMAGSIAAVCFQLIYVPIVNDLRITVAFFWGIFFLLFEVPVGAIVGALLGLVGGGVNAPLSPQSHIAKRILLAGFLSAITLTALLSAAELLIPGEGGFSLTFYASVVVIVGLVFGAFTWGYFRRAELAAGGDN